MNEPYLVLDRHAEWDFLRACSRKQQSTGRHITLPRHIIQSLDRPDFSLTPKCYEYLVTANTNFNVVGLSCLLIVTTLTIIPTGRSTTQFASDILLHVFKRILTDTQYIS